MSNYTQTELDEMTVPELKDICYDLGITGYSKKAKYDIINSIMAETGELYTEDNLYEKTVSQLRGICSDMGITGMSKATKEEIIDNIVAEAEEQNSETETTGGSSASVPVKKDAKVSCGAASGKFPVIGKSVGDVRAYLGDILNIESTATPVVNGGPVSGDYVLKSGDSLEFLKSAGRKG